MRTNSGMGEWETSSNNFFSRKMFNYLIVALNLFGMDKKV